MGSSPSPEAARAEIWIGAGGIDRRMRVTSGSGPVLVVEDDRDLADVVVDVLSLDGFDVEHAPDGRAALDCCAGRMPRLILLDMKMPVMDGWEFARLFRHQFGSDTPIVVVTAAESAAQRCREVGADACLAKPFDLDVLRSVVRKWTMAERAGA